MSDRRSFPPAPTEAHAVVLCAHPDGESFNTALADAWIEGARSRGATVERIELASLDFDPLRIGSHRKETALEPDLLRAQEAIARAAHVVVAFPVFWGSTPAVLQGFFDRAFLPGWAFAYVDHKPIGGLSGRTGRMLVTMDAPTWYDTLVYHRSARRQVSVATLRFCGITPVRTSAFGSIGTSTAALREKMLAQARAAGVADGSALVGRKRAVPQLA